MKFEPYISNLKRYLASEVIWRQKKGGTPGGNRTHDLLCHSDFAFRSAFLPNFCMRGGRAEERDRRQTDAPDTHSTCTERYERKSQGLELMQVTFCV